MLRCVSEVPQGKGVVWLEASDSSHTERAFAWQAARFCSNPSLPPGRSGSSLDEGL